MENDDRSGMSTVDNCDSGATGTGDGDSFAQKVDVFGIGAGGDQHRVSIVGRVDSGLDRRLVLRHIDGGREGIQGKGQDQGEQGGMAKFHKCLLKSISKYGAKGWAILATSHGRPG